MEENAGQKDWWALFEDLLEPGQTLLAPLQVVRSSLGANPSDRKRLDFKVELSLPTFGNERFRFAVEMATRSTLQELERKAERVRAGLDKGEFPLVAVPFLSSPMLVYVEENGLSALDLCGNGLVQVPGRLFVKRSGQPNRFPETRPLQNPFKGRSAMVARAFLMRPRYESVSQLWASITLAGVMLSLPQVSKAVSRLQDEALIERRDKEVSARDPLRLLDRLARYWVTPQLPRLWLSCQSPSWPALLDETPELRWAVAGSASSERYVAFAQGGPRRLMVSNLSKAMRALGGEVEPVSSFADFELCQTEEAGYFFANDVDEQGVRWASPTQTWLELQAGDARQQEAARDVRRQILEKLGQ